MASSRFNFKKIVFYIATLSVLILVFLKFSELKLIGSIFNGTNYHWLIVLLIVQVLMYYSQAFNYKYVLKIKDYEVPSHELFLISIVSQFANQALPMAGLSGQVFFIQYLKKYGIPVAEAFGRALIEIMTLYMTMGLFFIISSIVVFPAGVAEKLPEVKIVIYIFAFIAALCLLIYVFINRGKRGSLINWFLGKLHYYFEEKKKKSKNNSGEIIDHSKHVQIIIDLFKTNLNIRFLDKKKKDFWLAFVWYNIFFLCHVITLYAASWAVDFPITFGMAFVIFSFVKFVSMLSFIPGSIGIFEGSMSLMLAALGVPLEAALAMTLIMRALTFWLPLLVGWFLYKFYFKNLEFSNPYTELGQEGISK